MAKFKEKTHTKKLNVHRNSESNGWLLAKQSDYEQIFYFVTWLTKINYSILTWFLNKNAPYSSKLLQLQLFVNCKSIFYQSSISIFYCSKAHATSQRRQTHLLYLIWETLSFSHLIIYSQIFWCNDDKINQNKKKC